ncbi:MAG: hypothetical protein KGN01_07360, partial [Patescibacteria group bacterium]|nr:hypothetical protein [Patescibacteria group bacterium]
MPGQILNGWQTAVVQRQCSHANFMAMEVMRKSGLRVVYDLDDNFWNIPRYNPAIQWFGNKVALDWMGKCINLANAITVSTPVLKWVIEKKTRTKVPIFVIENSIDFDLFAPVRKHRKKETVTIGWAGTATHEIDYQHAF